jgi:hypothetical protein
METVMSAPFEWFAEWGEVREGKGRWTDMTARHIYINRGSSILGVAHLDSVQPYNELWVNEDYIQCATIDNRMGAWLMLYGLPALGIEIDVLLTENEEMGASTACDFVADKEYNWAFSFDRGGDDVACYQYYDTATSALLAKHGMKAAYGSYSDVADLDLGVKCFNFGVGMYNYHAETAYVRKWELNQMLVNFESLYQANKETRLPHTGQKRLWDEEYWGQYTSKSTTITKYTPPSEWDDEFNWKDNNFGTSSNYIYKGKTDLIDSHLSREAALYPYKFFGDTDDPTDWWYNHSMGDVNDPTLDGEVIALWEEAILVACDSCENLFVRGDIDRYVSMREWLCKACFHSFAITYYGS